MTARPVQAGSGRHADGGPISRSIVILAFAYRLRRARRLSRAGRHREADRTLNATAVACERFRAAHPERVRT